MAFKTSNPQCGDFFLVRISGFTGICVSAGQYLIGSGSYFTHAGIVGPNDDAIAAQPGGAEHTPLADAIGDRSRVVYSDFALSDETRSAIWQSALGYVGVPYSYLDYAAIAGMRLFHSDTLEAYAASTGHMICSQLVDQCYATAGHVLFSLSGDVTPGDLARMIGAK